MLKIWEITQEEFKSLSDDEKWSYWENDKTAYTPSHSNYHYIKCLDAFRGGEIIPERVQKGYRWGNPEYNPFK